MKNINPKNLSDEMSDALINFQVYAEKISDLWNEKANEDAMFSAEVMSNYPFAHSFDDVCFEIYCWVNAIRNYKTPLQKNIDFVKAHRKEVIDCINDVCEVGQNLLNHGCPITYADVYKTEDDEIFWFLWFDKGKYALTKLGTVSLDEIFGVEGNVRIWSLVMENLGNCDNHPEWNDHYYSDKLSYDSPEIDTCIEFMTHDAECEEERKNNKA